MKFIKWVINLLTVIDIFFNVLLSPLINLMLSDGSYKFGNNNETLSGVMGKNIKMNKCKGCKVICYLLSKLFNQKHHCIVSVDVNENEGIK